MSIDLRAGEIVRVQGKIHFVTYLKATAFSLCMLGLLGFVAYGVVSRANQKGFNDPEVERWILVAAIGIGCLFLLPPLLQILSNKMTVYVVTNERIFREEGIFSKTVVEIPLEKINDISSHQTLLQRVFGAGTVRVMTGNESYTTFFDLDNFEEFRAAIRRKS